MCFVAWIPFSFLYLCHSLDGEVAGRAKCEGDFETGAHWTNIRVFKTCNDEANSEDSTSSDDDDPTVMEQSSLEDRLKELAEV